MISVRWSHLVVPPPTQFQFSQSDEELVALPDPRAYRSLSRAGILLAAAALPAQGVLQPWLTRDPFSVGLYLALENGPVGAEAARQMIHTSPDDLAQTYRRLRTAKEYLRQLPNLPGAQLAIFLSALGPLTVFSHSRFGSHHALEAAVFDLEQGIVEAALVGTAHTLEEPLLAQRESREATVLAEGAAALVLVRGSETISLPTARDEGPFFGIAGPLIQYLEGNKHEHRNQ